MRPLRTTALALAWVLLVAAAPSATATPRLSVDSYVVAAHARDLALSIEDNSSEEGARAELAPLSRIPEQRWALSENDITALENLGTGKCLRFAMPYPVPDNPVIQADCDNSNRQTWYYVAADESFQTWRFENVGRDTCITAVELTHGARLVEAPCDENDPNQRWTSVEADES